MQIALPDLTRRVFRKETEFLMRERKTTIPQTQKTTGAT
jgi:hypothetical protein